MSTTFILHGGATSKESAENSVFFPKFTSLVSKEEVRIILCYWARERHTWNDMENRDVPKILHHAGGKKVSFTLAQDPDDLRIKLENSDVLYVAGGEAHLIEPYYRELSFLHSYLEGKVYLGSSMGAFLASKRYVLSSDEADSQTVHEGLGLVPVNMLCHWDVETQQAMKLRLLQKADPSGEIVTLNEHDVISRVL